MASATVKVEMDLSPGALLTQAGEELLTQTGRTLDVARWTDITADVLEDSKIRVRYGIFGTGMNDRVADIGELTFSLDNSIGNSGGLLGYYSPDHANLRTDFSVDQEVRLLLTYSGTTYYKFHGWIRDITPEAGEKGPRRVSVRVEDWMGIAARSKPAQIATQLSQTGDQLLSTLVDSMNRQPMATSFATGQTTFDYGLDTTRDETTTFMRECQKISMSGLEYIYVNGDTSTGGVLTYEDRHARAKIGSASSDLDNVMRGLNSGQSVSVIYNRVNVTVHPRTVDAAATTVLYSLVNEIAIGPGETKTLIGQYRDENQRQLRVGGTAMVTPVATTDYTMYSETAGGGADLTADLTVTASYGGNSVRYTLTNGNAATGYVNFLQARGKGVYDYQPSILEASDDYGDSLLEINASYLSDELVGQDMANHLHNVLDMARTLVPMVEFVGNYSDALMLAGLAREIGDRVTLTETATGIDSDWFINGVEVEISSGDIIQFRWCVAPQADVGSFWIMDLSELDTGTILGY